MDQSNSSSKKSGSTKIVQFADETKTLPDGSTIIYAENDDNIVVYHKLPFEKGTTYVYKRKTGKILVNNKPGTNKDKRRMIKLGSYMMDNASEDDLVTISVKSKDDYI
ncbi:MAG: hypothetical protein GY730_02320 [bacterium]|nr:hypothetical protein [bacterium]